MPGECAGVYVADADDLMLPQVVIQRLLAAVVGHHGASLAYNEARHHGSIISALRVVGVDTSITDMDRGHRDQLAGEGWICEDFLIPAHASGEHHFTGRCARSAKALSFKDTAVR